MCGRYYVDDETAREIIRLVHNLDRRFRRGPDPDTVPTEAQKAAHGPEVRAAAASAAVFPSQDATVIMGKMGKERRLEAKRMVWGFPRFDGNGLLINARAETAMERRSFRESVLHRRCVIPARGFWSRISWKTG